MQFARIAVWTTVFFAASTALAQNPRQPQGTPAEALETLPDFKVERLLSADPKVHGSWISMGLDNKGRLLLGGLRHGPFHVFDDLLDFAPQFIVHGVGRIHDEEGPFIQRDGGVLVALRDLFGGGPGEALREEVGAEFKRHQLLARQQPVPASDHELGLAFDAAVALPRAARLNRKRVTVDKLAALAGITRPNSRRDPVHFKLLPERLTAGSLRPNRPGLIPLPSSAEF